MGVPHSPARITVQREIGQSGLALFCYAPNPNFAVSFAIEALVAQPIARAVMNRFHRAIDTRRPEAVSMSAEQEG